MAEVQSTFVTTLPFWEGSQVIAGTKSRLVGSKPCFLLRAPFEILLVSGLVIVRAFNQAVIWDVSSKAPHNT